MVEKFTVINLTFVSNLKCLFVLAPGSDYAVAVGFVVVVVVAADDVQHTG